MKTRLYLVCLLCAAGCTSARTLSTDMEAVRATLNASEEDIFYTTQRVFVQEGYLLDRTERATGTIATEARLVTAQDVQIQCSGTPDAGALKLSFGARVQRHELTLWTRTEASRKAGNCVSSGAVEQAMIEKIRAAINA